MAKVYTREGDDGTTALWGGGRVLKNSPLPRAYGAVDEAQAFVGAARAEAGPGSELDELLTEVARDLWLVMTELATNHTRPLSGARVTDERVDELERVIDEVSSRFEPPKDFAVPGQGPLPAALDVARVTVRRAERECVGTVRPDSAILRYLNRLSDLLWMLARWQGVEHRSREGMNRCPGVMIAASHSGAGKTTVTAALLTALRRRGVRVQAFKLGPDFIDPAYHAEATGRPAINLDPWMMGIDGVRASFHRWSQGADFAVIEAMGALHDGTADTGHGSPAEMATLLDVPVIVVLDVWGMTRTTAAVLQGLISFDPEVNIAGCILNRVGSAAHARMILEALPERLRDLVLGTVPARPQLAIPERHLGLTTVHDNQTTPADRDLALTAAATGLDLDRIMSVATGQPLSAPPVVRTAPTRPARHQVARLAIAVDRAFSFYYEENLALLRKAGFELVPFRPTADKRLPEGTAAVYLGGGYPEYALEALAANTLLATELRDRAAAGVPVYAECGGLMYLARSVTTIEGNRYELLGLLPIDIGMDPDHLAIRYVEVTTRVDSPLGPAGTVARGQEFHQSRITCAELEPNLYDLSTSGAPTGSRAGYLLGNIAASYIHLHLASNPDVAGHLMSTALAPKRFPAPSSRS